MNITKIKRNSIGVARFLAVTICTTAIVVSCNSPAKKVDKATENVLQAQEELNKAQVEYAADVENFRNESNTRIAENEKIIADMNAKMANEKRQLKANYREQVAAIEQKNNNMKRKMSEYKADTKDNWEAFKTEFNYDMSEMSKALNNLVSNNKK